MGKLLEVLLRRSGVNVYTNKQATNKSHGEFAMTLHVVISQPSGADLRMKEGGGTCRPTSDSIKIRNTLIEQSPTLIKQLLTNTGFLIMPMLNFQ